MTRQWPSAFRVAFSFAGEQRALVKQIASAVEHNLGEGTVFFDEWYEHVISGHDSDLLLQEVYHNRSTMVVVCVSRSYDSKQWTKVENEAIRSLFMKLRANDNENDRLRVLPLRFGDGDIPGILSTVICPDVRQKSVEGVSQLIIDRLAEIERLSEDLKGEQQTENQAKGLALRQHPSNIRPKVYPWRGVTFEEAVMLFPEGPNVKEPIPYALLRDRADLTSPNLARQLVNEANRVRTAKDPGEERTKQVSQSRLLEPSVGMEPFVGAALDQARLKGPRTVAAFLLVFCDELPAHIKASCDDVLSMLIEYQQR